MNCPGCGMWVNPGAPHTCSVGRNCVFCGQWIAPNISHVCANQMQQPGPGSFAEQRMATALESVNILMGQVRDQLTKLVTLYEQRLEFDMSLYTDDEDAAVDPPA